MRINGTTISMIRGDSESIIVSCKDSNGNPVPFKEGDTVYFTVKETVNTEVKMLQKVITEFEDGKAIIDIKPEDTKHFRFQNYVYDIQLTRADGTVTTIIPPSKFKVKGEVTYE